MDEPPFESNTETSSPPTKVARAKVKASANRAAPAPKPLATFQDLLSAELGPMTEALRDLFDKAVGYANGQAGNGEWVLDIEAVMFALRTQMPSGWDGSAHDVFQKWAEGERWRLPAVRKEGLTSEELAGSATDPASAAGRGLKPTLSASMLGTVLPGLRATGGAVRRPGASGRSIVGVRHLVATLATMELSHWSPAWIERQRLPEAAARLRQMLASAAPSFSSREEYPDLWQRWLSATPAADASRKPPLAEHTPLLSDNPAAVDELGRKPLADALAARLVRLQRGEAASSDPKAVMVHLHGPWGSGKSSLVRFLAEALNRESPRWLVVDFNAWRNARVKPPWWYMLTEWKRLLSRRMLADVTLLRWAWLQLRWAWVSPSVDNIVLVAGGLLVVALFVLFGDDAGQIKDRLKGGPEMLTLVTGTIAGLVAGGRALLLGSKQAADSFDALRTDSYRPFVRLFDMLAKAAPCPVLIVLDDLDRCDQETVTDLLEGIQTLFRNQPVVFMAVADRHWITASFAERFKLFDDGADRARPVGDLFLDKMFQVSVSIPALPIAVKRRYLGRLVGVQIDETPSAHLPDTALRHEEIQAAIAAAPEDERPALRAQGVARLATAAADKVIEHRLLRWVGHIEPNPRGMKRLVNAIGMVQARSLLEGRDVEFDAIVLWTILELRWPRAATAITANPALIDAEDQGSEALKAAWTDPMFRKLANELDAVQVRALIGAVDDDDDDDENGVEI